MQTKGKMYVSFFLSWQYSFFYSYENTEAPFEDYGVSIKTSTQS